MHRDMTLSTIGSNQHLAESSETPTACEVRQATLETGDVRIVGTTRKFQFRGVGSSLGSDMYRQSGAANADGARRLIH